MFCTWWATSFRWSIVTMRPSDTVVEIWRLKCWTHRLGHLKKDGRKEKEGGRGRGRKWKGEGIREGEKEGKGMGR